VRSTLKSLKSLKFGKVLNNNNLTSWEILGYDLPHIFRTTRGPDCRGTTAINDGCGYSQKYIQGFGWKLRGKRQLGRPRRNGGIMFKVYLKEAE
jgi:hypothetical protein